MGEKGTSLVEVMFVLALVGILAATSADSLLAAFPRAERQTALAELVTELRTARQLAIRHRRAAHVRLEALPGVLQVQSSDGSVWRRYRYADKGIVALSLSRGSTIVFYPTGRAASPVTITATTRRGVTARLTVTLTGKVNWS